MTIAEQLEFLKKGTIDFIREEDLKKKLERSQKTGKPLRFDSATFSPLDPTDIPYILLNSDRCDVAVDSKVSKIPAQ